MPADPRAPAGQFSAHNVALPNGTMTLPGVPLLEGTPVCQAALAQLGALRPCCKHPGTGICMCDCHDRPAPKVADLGCLDGGYAAAFARAGYDTVGIDARSVNIERARWLQGQLGLKNLHFAHADVRPYLRNIETLGGSYDAVFCCGLLYHLDKPAEFLRLLGRLTPLLILNTHISERPDARHEGYAGHWQVEARGDRWSSWVNPLSFWPTENALLGMIEAAGFTSCTRLPAEHRETRGMWVATKP